MILDTNALSGVADNDAALGSILSRADQVAIPVIVIGEYRYGIAQSRYRARYERWLEGLIGDCIVLNITNETTRYYAAVNYELRQAGNPIPTNDLWIAALSREHHQPIVSRDHHFDAVQGIRRISW
ncbi:MAG TPA: type II toxin-antitoxin system VapC family toxin [Terriglobales bacterium]|jgi:predicted nucleic acid-binding protein|nr:type II toxin-antitoxin system VapC family toxin [Terriglobales bacterium]